MNLEFMGRVFFTPSALTMIVDGIEVHSGQVGADQLLDNEIVLVELADVTPATTLSVAISVTSGVITLGQVLENDGAEQISNDLRSNILINGVAPIWPATPVVPMPGGDIGTPDWAGWFFELNAGETMTLNVVIPPLPPPPEPPIL